VPMYFAIPTEMNPGWGYKFRPGVVHIYVQPPIPTNDWKLEDLDENRQKMHRTFLELQNRYEGK